MTFRGDDLTTPATPDSSQAPQHAFPGSHPYTCVGRWAGLSRDPSGPRTNPRPISRSLKRCGKATFLLQQPSHGRPPRSSLQGPAGWRSFPDCSVRRCADSPGRIAAQKSIAGHPRRAVRRPGTSHIGPARRTASGPAGRESRWPRRVVPGLALSRAARGRPLAAASPRPISASSAGYPG
jgi:hypothetical protein